MWQQRLYRKKYVAWCCAGHHMSMSRQCAEAALPSLLPRTRGVPEGRGNLQSVARKMLSQTRRAHNSELLLIHHRQDMHATYIQLAKHVDRGSMDRPFCLHPSTRLVCAASNIRKHAYEQATLRPLRAMRWHASASVEAIYLLHWPFRSCGHFPLWCS